MCADRLDTLVVERGLADSREQAQRLIRAGQVLVRDQVAAKPGHRFAEDSDIRVKTRPRFVSRGGEKLEAAFAAFPLQVEALDCMDAGASTGGFTDCLLQHGAARVLAVDVGRGQLNWSLRNDARVVVMEGVNARYLESGDLPFVPRVTVMDLSFISLRNVLPAVCRVMTAGGDLVTLIKPQFEAGREAVGKGGVVRDPAVHQAVIHQVRIFGEAELGLAWQGVCESPLRGPAGNVEFLAYWKVRNTE